MCEPNIFYVSITIIRTKAEWIDANMTIMELNTKACCTLTCTLSRNEYNKVCRLKTTKEIWDSLSINYEGIKDVQLRKDATLSHQCKSFCMKEGEFVDDMFKRL